MYRLKEQEGSRHLDQLLEHRMRRSIYMSHPRRRCMIKERESSRDVEGALRCGSQPFCGILWLPDEAHFNAANWDHHAGQLRKGVRGSQAQCKREVI